MLLDKFLLFLLSQHFNKDILIHCNCYIHANEWLTCIILLEFLHEYCASIQNNSTIWGFSARNLFNNTSIYIMPIVNPDGVDLVTGALPSNSNAYKQAQQIAANFPNIPFVEGWKANIRGVELSNFQ